MIEAAEQSCRNACNEYCDYYRAMLSAAPKAPSADDWKDAELQELYQAIAYNVRAFMHEETGVVRHSLVEAMNDDKGWKEVMIIPNISNAAIDAARAAQKETKE